MCVLMMAVVREKVRVGQKFGDMTGQRVDEGVHACPCHGRVVDDKFAEILQRPARLLGWEGEVDDILVTRQRLVEVDRVERRVVGVAGARVEEDTFGVARMAHRLLDELGQRDTRIGAVRRPAVGRVEAEATVEILDARVHSFAIRTKSERVQKTLVGGFAHQEGAVFLAVQ